MWLMGQSSLPFKQNAHNGLLLKQMFTLALLSPRQHTKYFFILFIFDFPKQPLSSAVLFVFFTFPNTELFSSPVMLPLLSACSFFLLKTLGPPVGHWGRHWSYNSIRSALYSQLFLKNPSPTSGPLTLEVEVSVNFFQIWVFFIMCCCVVLLVFLFFPLDAEKSGKREWK